MAKIATERSHSQRASSVKKSFSASKSPKSPSTTGFKRRVEEFNLGGSGVKPSNAKPASSNQSPAKMPHSGQRSAGQVSASAKQWVEKTATKPAQPIDRKAQQAQEMKLYGVNSGLVFFKLYPAKVIKAYLTEANAKGKFKALVKWCVANKKAYHIVSDLELEKITESKHHEGVCLLVKTEPQLELTNWLASLPAQAKGAVLLLDRVGNPHNLGAIMRVAAHYGVIAMVTCNPQALRTGSAVRTSEGGALYVPVLRANSMEQAVKLLQKEKFCVMATSSYHSQDVYKTKLPARSAFILGEESEGVDPHLATISDLNVIIQGTGKVESLNVSVAAALLCSEYWRQHLPK